MWSSSYGTLGTETAHMMVPRRSRGDFRAVVYAHGAGQTAANIYQNGTVSPWLFPEAGMLFVAADLGGGATWGNATAMQKITDAWNAAIAAGARSDKVLLYGGSMGSLNAMRWATANPTLTAALAVVLPIVNVADVRANNRGGYQSAIDASGTSLTVDSPAPLASAGIPSHFWYSGDDPIGLPSLATAFAASAGGVSSTFGSVGHSVTGFAPQEAADFLKQYA